ncbi:GNAT family N-acetyltransferase [Teredinibacter turnerae]|uniref:GNAT family N-acetyltransferase n=1 Tax=Teredinibacter turnerae TaxID=2426 RepID=UPI0005F8623F|nr:GNAT family N-acetyltransferase [Teredinibacter turnerae]
MLRFIDAEIKHKDLLRDTLISSKGYWGYTQGQLEQWRANLNFEDAYIARNIVKLVLDDTGVIGFFALIRGEVNELDHLWLLPRAIGKGYGNRVFEQILTEFVLLDITEFYLTSDPNAEGFYLKKGAFKVGEVYSEPQNRMLPRLKYFVVTRT